MSENVKQLILSLIMVVILCVGVYMIATRNSTSATSTPPPTTVRTLPSPSSHVTTSPTGSPAPGSLNARLDGVDTSALKLGQPSSASIDITNTGTEPITRERVVFTAGRDFGWLIGYQSRTSIQDFVVEIQPGKSARLEEQFDLPLTENFVSLEGDYAVTVTVTANDGYLVGEWIRCSTTSPINLKPNWDGRHKSSITIS